VVLVVTVGGTLTREVVALHATGEALTLRDCGGVDHLALFERVGEDLLADLVARDVVEAKLDELLPGVTPAFSKCPSSALVMVELRRTPHVTCTAA